MSTWTEIERIFEETRDEFLSNPCIENAMEINCGDCADFLKACAKKLDEIGVEYKVIVTQDFELMDELEGFKTFKTKNEDAVSHCYLEIDGWFFDAQNIDGSEEFEMEFLNNPEYI